MSAIAYTVHMSKPENQTKRRRIVSDSKCRPVALRLAATWVRIVKAQLAAQGPV